VGGTGLVIPVRAAPEEAAALAGLHRAVWDVIVGRIDALARRKGTREILARYRSETAASLVPVPVQQPDDGIGLRFLADSAAGSRTREERAFLHWALRAALDQWPRITVVAGERGARLGLPELDARPGPADAAADEPAAERLAGLLTGRGAEVFFFLGGRLGCATTDLSPGPDTELLMPGETRRLSRMRGPERDRVTWLIRTGRCACELCQRLRAGHGLPLAPVPLRLPYMGKGPANRPSPPRPDRPAATA